MFLHLKDMPDPLPPNALEQSRLLAGSARPNLVQGAESCAVLPRGCAIYLGERRQMPEIDVEGFRSLTAGTRN